MTNIICPISVHVFVWYLFSRQNITRINADLLSNGAYGTILHFFFRSERNFACKPNDLGRYSATLKFHLASCAARLRIAACLPGDYNIPRNSFNSLSDLPEIWYTRHWWAEAVAHQFWVEYDNSLRWRHNERDSVSNHQPHDCLLNRLFRRRSKKTPSMRIGCWAI